MVSFLERGAVSALKALSPYLEKPGGQRSCMSENFETQSTPADSVGNEGRLLLWVVLAALAVRLVVVAVVYPGFLAPGRDHWEFGYETGKIARSIVQGHGFANPYYGGDTGPTAEVAPILPYMMAGIFALFGVYTKAAVVAMLGLNSLFSALTCIPIYFAARMSFGLREARWSAWTWAFFPYAIYFSADLMWDHALVALLLTFLFWMTLHLGGSNRIRAWAGFGLLCGVSALTDPVVLGIVPFLAGWACYRLHEKGKAWLLSAGTSAFLACAVIAPWLVRNYRVFHQPVFLKDGFPIVFCDGNVGNTLHWWNGSVDPSGNSAEMAAFHRLGEQGYMAEKWLKARDFVEENPGTFGWRSVRRFVFMWTGYWSFNREYLREEPFDPGNIPFCTGVTILALCGIRKVFRKSASLGVLYGLLLIVFPLVYYFTVSEMGYRHPLSPEVVILACGAVAAWRSAPSGAAERQERAGAVPFYAD
jgi:4-amino-4-deoxy-L-arabinose transferase-like glycosyltransferase